MKTVRVRTFIFTILAVVGCGWDAAALAASVAGTAGFHQGGLGFGAESWGAIGTNWQLGLFGQSTRAELDAADQEEEKSGKEETAAAAPEIVETISINSRTLGLKARRFFGGSFYLTAAVGYTEYDGDYGFRLGFIKSTQPFSGKGGMAVFGLGNQWELGDGFLIGCDWISIGQLFGGTPKFDNGMVDEDGRLKKVVGNVYSFALLNLRVGYSF